MKKDLSPLPRILIALSTLTFVGLPQVPVHAQSFVDSLSPRRSEDFFKQGRQQLELEIQRLQTPLPAAPLLTIRPELQQQTQMEIQQLENRTLPAQPGQPEAPPPTQVSPTNGAKAPQHLTD